VLAVAGGILLAIFILLVLIGLGAWVRNVFRFVRRRGADLLYVPLLLIAILYIGWRLYNGTGL
jgi:hypothetical protein